jgi:TusA-related sulfurtransferase
MNKLNCFGDFCPVPLLKAQREVKKLQTGESLMVVTDHSCVVESIDEYFGLRHFKLSIEEAINGVWEITITKV